MLVFFPAASAPSQTLRDLIPPVGASRNTASTTPPHPSVARIIVPERGGTSYGSGSLVDVHNDYALVVTNWHVVSDRIGEVSVLFPDGFQSAGKVLKVDKDWDLAAIGIWRPPAQPLHFAARAPVIGEPLAIAGYGAGQWRFATGRCSQFVSPGSSFPPDMVEVSVEARQGDSGGPIFNQQGEIAGVLFGAGRGSTSGSHTLRVQSFLESVYPILREAPEASLASSRGQNRDQAAKQAVIAQSSWQEGAAEAATVAETAALQIREEPKAAPLVAAKETPRRATEQELRDWVSPGKHEQEESIAPETAQSERAEAKARVARIERKQFGLAADDRSKSSLAEKNEPALVAPRDQADCSKFDPAFPNLSGGIEGGETFSLADAEQSRAAPASSAGAPPKEGLFEQGKTFLALLGGVAIAFQVLKFLGQSA